MTTINLTSDNLIAIMAIVTAYVAYFKAFNIIPTKYLPLVALGLSFGFVACPSQYFNEISVASMIGLGATGFYHTATQNLNLFSKNPKPKIDKRQYVKRNYNHMHDTQDSRDFLYEPKLSAIPSKRSLRNFFPPVFDQGQLGSCTANGILGLRGYYMIASGLVWTELSRLFLYFKERELEGSINEDSGAMIRDGMKVLQSVGCAPEIDFPYEPATFAQQPSKTAELDAGQFKIAAYHRVTSLKSLKAAIASGQPVVFGFRVYPSFESQSVADTGLVPIPDTTKEQCLGGHCVVAVGYDDTTQLVEVRNSWGAGWGDKGYCYMPYAMFQFPLVTDMWVGKLNAPVRLEELSFLQAIQHFVDAGVLDNPPTYWTNFDAKLKDGTLTIADCTYVPTLIQKLAARDITMTEL